MNRPVKTCEAEVWTEKGTFRENVLPAGENRNYPAWSLTEG